MTDPTISAPPKWSVGPWMYTPEGTQSIEDERSKDVAYAYPEHAALIAAAPDLLAALKECIAANGPLAPTQRVADAYQAARVVVAKAEGR